MSAIVVDTNVLLVADGQASQMSEECKLSCQTRLQNVIAGEQVVVDYEWHILGEYHNKLDSNKQATPGAAFVKWILQRQGNPKHVAWVQITSKDQYGTCFDEFPKDDDLFNAFDPADRKFVAASCAHTEKPPIIECADSKWIGWEARLATHGVKVEFVCGNELSKIRERKTK